MTRSLDNSPVQIGELGLRAVIAHSERNKNLALETDRIRIWADFDPIMQNTGASLLGRFGSTNQRASFQFLDVPLKPPVAIDAYDTASRQPCLTEAFGKAFLARQLFIEGPLAVLGAVNEQQKECVTRRRA